MRKLDRETKQLQGTFEPSKEIEAVELTEWNVSRMPMADKNWPPRIQKLWNDRCKDLQAAGYLTSAFLVGLKQYCFAVMMAQEAQYKLMDDADDGGFVVKEIGTEGQVYYVPSKWLTVLEKAEKTIDRYEKKFGFTPYDSSKIPKVKKIETSSENLLE